VTRARGVNRRSCLRQWDSARDGAIAEIRVLVRHQAVLIHLGHHLDMNDFVWTLKQGIDERPGELSRHGEERQSN
jgi:hypothetical protein